MGYGRKGKEMPEKKEKKDKEVREAGEAAVSQETGEKEKSVKKSKKKKTRRRPRSQTKFFAGLAVLTATISAVLFFSEFWAFTTWAGLKMDEIIYHLRAPLEGTGGGMMEKYVSRCILPSILIMLCIFSMIVHTRKAPKARGLFVKRTLVGASLALVITLVVGTVKLDVINYVKNQMQDSTFIEDNYVDPQKTAITFPEKKRNLIYIYLESMEITFSDEQSGGAFPDNVIPELTELAMEGDDFSGDTGMLNGGHVMPGSTYTMAGIFSQSTGLPLKMDLGEEFTDARGSFNKMNTQDSFFSGVTTLGDILEGEGYNQAFMMGSDATFGGRRLYLTEHGEYEICDYKWAIEQGLLPMDYYVFWGYEDEKLFSYAKEKVLELSKQEEPFNFSMLTVDTHFEDGYRCSLCRDDFEGNQYANSFACSSRQVNQFIRWIQEQDFYENTTIVLSGDHLTMDSDFCINVPSSYDRRTYTAYINSACEPADPSRVREYTTLDNLPTTLAAMGVTIEGDRLGLGTNLYGTKDTLFETYGMEEFSSLLSKKSSFMQKLANINLYDEDLLRAQGLAPSAQIEITELDEENGSLSLAVHDFKNIHEKITSVEVEAWDNDNPDKVVKQKMSQEKKNYYTTALSGYALPGESVGTDEDEKEDREETDEETGEETGDAGSEDLVEDGTGDIAEDRAGSGDIVSEGDETGDLVTEGTGDGDLVSEETGDGDLVTEGTQDGDIMTEGTGDGDAEENSNAERKAIKENGAEYAEESEDAVPGGSDAAGEEGESAEDLSLKGINLKSCNVYIYANGKSGRRYEVGRMTGDLTLRTDDIYEYLDLLQRNRQYSIFVTVRDDATREITSDLQKELAELGLEEVLPGHYRWSYYCILIPGQEKREEISEKELSCTGTLPDGVRYSVISQGGLSGAGGGAGRYLTCSVKINNIEYAVQRIGLNFVIYDNEHSVVADSVEFNTYDGLGARRKEPSLQAAD